MKKTLFALMALTLVCAIALSSCKKDPEEVVPEPTKEELLTQEKGWFLVSATSYPKYVPLEGEPNEDLRIVFFYPCELDDINYFKPNKDMVRGFGALLCDGEVGQEETLGKWKFISDEVLQFYLPAYFDENGNYEPLEAKIITLNETTLQLRVPIYEYRNVEPTYQFTLKYSKLP